MRRNVKDSFFTRTDGKVPTLTPGLSTSVSTPCTSTTYRPCPNMGPADRGLSPFLHSVDTDLGKVSTLLTTSLFVPSLVCPWGLAGSGLDPEKWTR